MLTPEQKARRKWLMLGAKIIISLLVILWFIYPIIFEVVMKISISFTILYFIFGNKIKILKDKKNENQPQSKSTRSTN